MQRTLGTLGPVSAMGFGGWAIGGPFSSAEGKPRGYGEVDDEESIRAVLRALELGVTLFDTADVYGAGHGERMLGRALAGHRDDVVIATKFGHTFDVEQRRVTGSDATPAAIRAACLASLERLATDRIDLYQFHLADYPITRAAEVRETLESLVAEGLIRAYAWSTDDPERAEVFASGRNCVAVQHEVNVFHPAFDMVRLCEREKLASVNRSPLAMGLLTGKFDEHSRLAPGDIRGDQPAWLRYFADGRPREHFLERLALVRDILTRGDRTLAQGALAYVWSVSEATIPIPGCRNVAQVEENAGAMAAGPLAKAEADRIDQLLA